MNTVLWICQGFLALVFLYSGVSKSFLSREVLVAKGQTGVDGLPVPLIRFIGITEVLGSVGIILPWLLDIFPVLTPVSAWAFAFIMVLAAPIHYRRREIKAVFFNVFLLLLCVWVGIQRLKQ